MSRFFILIFLFFVSCSKKDSTKPTTIDHFEKLQNRMWKLDSIVYLQFGTADVFIPPTMNSQYVKFTSTKLQYYSSANSEPPVILELDSANYQQPNIVEVWNPGITSGAASYKIEVDTVTDTQLRYNFLNTPDYTKTRKYYYHSY